MRPPRWPTARWCAAGIAGLRASGHGGDQMLLGETGPIGRVSGRLATRPVPPAAFIRTLLCIDRDGDALRGKAAAVSDCAQPRRLRVTGFAHHPYSQGGSKPPETRGKRATEITISSVGRLKRVLDAGARRGRIPKSLPIHYTEYGFQTNPPDLLFGVSPARQAEYINQSDWIAYRDKRIRTVAQYKLVDDTVVSSFQSGLRFWDGLPKPAYGAYRLPLWVTRKGLSRLRVYGQVRPLAGGATTRLQLQNAALGAGPFRTVEHDHGQLVEQHVPRDDPAPRGPLAPALDGARRRRAALARGRRGSALTQLPASGAGPCLDGVAQRDPSRAPRERTGGVRRRAGPGGDRLDRERRGPAYRGGFDTVATASYAASTGGGQRRPARARRRHARGDRPRRGDLRAGRLRPGRHTLGALHLPGRRSASWTCGWATWRTASVPPDRSHDSAPGGDGDDVLSAGGRVPLLGHGVTFAGDAGDDMIDGTNLARTTSTVATAPTSSQAATAPTTSAAASATT